MYVRSHACVFVCFVCVFGVGTSGGKWETALQLLELMPSEGVTPDLMTYNIALDACVKVHGRSFETHRHCPV